MNNGIGNQASLRRLMRDLKEITNEPIQGVSAAPVNDNLYVWHGNLDVSLFEGGDGVAFHYVMTFSEDYPRLGPRIEFTNIPLRNAFDRNLFMCADILKRRRGPWWYTMGYDYRWPDWCRGWRISYTVRSLLMQLQFFAGLLTDERLIHLDDMPYAVELAKPFKCLECEHEPNNVWPPIPTIADIQAATAKIAVKMPTLATLLPSASVSLEIWEDISLPAVKPTLKAVIRQADGWNLVTRKSLSKGTYDSIAAVNHFDLLPAVAAVEVEKASEVTPAVSEVLPSVESEEREFTPATSEEPNPAGQIKESERKDTKTARKNRARAQKRALIRGQNQIPAEAIPSDISPARCTSSASKLGYINITPGKQQGSLGDLPYEVLLSVISRLPTLKDIMALASTCRGLHNVVEDGLLWREVFCRQYPKSNLTAASMKDWKYAYAMEHNNIISETVCSHTKMNINEEILGIRINFNRWGVDDEQGTMDFIGVTAYKDECARKSRWEQERNSFLPLYFTQDHFSRALNEFKKSIVQLSPRWRNDIKERFKPAMVLRVLPKLINSYVVELSEQYTYASEKAIHGYFLIYRLMITMLEMYPQLKHEIHERVKNYVLDVGARNKTHYPSLGEFIPLVTISSFSWNVVGPAVLSEMFDRNAFWICRRHPELASVSWEASTIANRLEKSFQASLISNRLLMFHVCFMRNFRRKPLTAMAAELDMFYGQPTAAVTRTFQAQIKRILAVKTWPEFYAYIQLPCPTKVQLSQILKKSVVNSVSKEYQRNTIKRR